MSEHSRIPDFLHALLFTLAFTIVTTILINVAAFFVAYMFTKAMRGAKLFRFGVL